MATTKLPKLPDWIADKLKSPVAAAAALTIGIRFGQEAYRLQMGEISQEEFMRRLSVHMGAASGTIGGAAIGSLAGIWFPGIGRLAGAFCGGMVGQLAGQHLGRISADRLVKRKAKRLHEEEVPPEIPPPPKRHI
jgi:hypothetical protein